MRTLRFLLVPILGFVILAGGLAAHATTASPPVDHALLAALQTKSAPAGETFPAVVARVGDRQLSAADFARAVAMEGLVNAQQHRGMSHSQIEQAALNQFIREAALINRANAEGVAVSNAEVSSFINQQAAFQSGLAPSDPALAAFYASMTAKGDATPEAYFRDPTIVQHMHDLLLLGKVIAKHVGAKPSGVVVEAFVQQTIAASGARVFVTVN
jgi:SurA N-terminal domain